MNQEFNLGQVELAFLCNSGVKCEKIEGPREDCWGESMCLRDDQRKWREKVELRRNTQEVRRNTRSMGVIEIWRKFSKRRK